MKPTEIEQLDSLNETALKAKLKDSYRHIALLEDIIERVSKERNYLFDKCTKLLDERHEQLKTAAV